jgi:DNA modification methylase
MPDHDPTSSPAAPNLLYYGDNLDVLRRHVKDESVDLVYLDPPFNSSASYNVLFAEHGAKSAAQIHAFEDTWQWDDTASLDYEQTVEQGGDVAEALRAFRTLLGTSDMLAYLSMMAPRLTELRRVMKQSASIYLHCDPTASHYLKLLMDGVFGTRYFRNEIIWKRTAAHSDTTQGAVHLGRVHDTLLFYSKGNEPTRNPVKLPYSREYSQSHYRYIEPETGRLYRKGDLTAARPGGDTLYDWTGPDGRAVRPYPGRYWAYSKENMLQFAAADRLVYTTSGMPEYKRYLDEMPGQSVQDVWDDIPPINSQAAERLGYPTQKPEALLERVIALSSNKDEVVLDPFCGCGTTVAAAQKLARRWIGIDITHLAIGLIKHRLADTYGSSIASSYQVIGEPTDVEGARELAETDPFQFQAWALGLVGARIASSAKKGGDKGIDGRLYFHDEGAGGKTKQIIFSVKAGHLVPTYLRDLGWVVDREKAQLGVLLSFETPSAGMRAEAASAGFYTSPWGTSHPRLQLLTVAQLLEGGRIDYPDISGGAATFRRARPPRPPKPSQGQLGLDASDA